MRHDRSGVIVRAALAAALGAAVGTPRTAEAQRIAGVVTDSGGRTIIEADVIGGTSTRTRTDSTGAFSLVLPERGRQRLRVRYIGFRPFEVTVDPGAANAQSLRIVLIRMPQLLAEVRITDVDSCERNTLRGFECRRASGRGVYRDAGEIRALRPSAWSDMLDGIPSLRRAPVMTPDGLDYRPIAPPSSCLVSIFNGEDPMFDGHVRKVPVLHLVTQDVVAIEYYDEYAKVPEALKRFAWPGNRPETEVEASAAPTSMPRGSPCALLVYWLREAPRRVRDRRGSSGDPTVIIRRP